MSCSTHKNALSTRAETAQKYLNKAERQATEQKPGRRTRNLQVPAEENGLKKHFRSLFPHGLVRTRNQKLPNHCLNVARFRTGILSWHRRHLPHLPRLPSYTLVVSVYRLENAVHDIRTVANSEAAAHVLHDHENQL